MVSNSVGGPRICMGIGETGLKWAYVFNGGQCWVSAVNSPACMYELRGCLTVC